MKHLSLLALAMVAGVIRQPSDGVIAVADDAEADRLIAAGLAVDVSAEFATPIEPPAEPLAPPAIETADDPQV